MSAAVHCGAGLVKRGDMNSPSPSWPSSPTSSLPFIECTKSPSWRRRLLEIIGAIEAWPATPRGRKRAEAGPLCLTPQPGAAHQFQSPARARGRQYVCPTRGGYNRRVPSCNRSGAMDRPCRFLDWWKKTIVTASGSRLASEVLDAAESSSPLVSAIVRACSAWTTSSLLPGTFRPKFEHSRRSKPATAAMQRRAAWILQGVSLGNTDAPSDTCVTLQLQPHRFALEISQPC